MTLRHPKWLLYIGICQIAITYTVLVPILLYFCAKFRKIPLDSATFKHRDKTLVYYMNIVSIISLTLEIPVDIGANVFHEDTMQHISASFFMWILFILFTVKSWILFFSLNYHNSLFKLQWKKEINARYRSWYILNRNTYGNLKYCLRITIIPFIFYMIIVTASQYLFRTDLSIYSSLILWCFVIIPSFILYRKLTVMHDMFHIRKELYYHQTIICISLTIIVFIGLFLAVLSKHILPQSIVSDVTRIQKLVNAFIESIAVFSISLVSTWYPCKTHQQNTPTSTPPADPSISSSEDKAAPSINAMLECIADRKGFAQFMTHLVQEFATENMLFLCEYIQIKYELQRKYKGLIRVKKQAHFGDYKLQNINDDDEYITIDFNVINLHEEAPLFSAQPSLANSLRTMKTFKRMQSTSVRRGRGVYSFLFMSTGILWDIVRLPSGLPKAEILNKKDCFTERLYGLFEKYIVFGTMHEINIPYLQRQTATKIMENMMQAEYKEDEEYEEMECNLCNVLDELCIEVIHLMAHSYSRFARNVAGSKSSPKIVKKQIKSAAGDGKTETLAASMSEAVQAGDDPKLIMRNGDSYNKLREHYQIDEIEIWPFYM